uniref:Uncharacterized protein n=1 Tax=Anguilla anguilla TaxID=7936 RepID=A0A0E9VR77_ANGAN
MYVCTVYFNIKMFKLCFWREGQVSTLWPMNHFV